VTVTQAQTPAAPIGTFAGLPLYRHGTAPAHLRTVTRLAAIRLQPAPGQRPVCYVVPYYHPDERRALYEPADAAPIIRSVGDEWAWRTRRTCPKCGKVREQVLNGRVCGRCRLDGERARKALDARTCGEPLHQCRVHRALAELDGYDGEVGYFRVDVAAWRLELTAVEA